MQRDDNTNGIDRELTAIVSRVLGLRPAELTDEVSMDTCGPWDSLRHIELLMAVEAGLGVRFPTAEMPALRDVGRIRAAVRRLAVGR